MLKSPCLLSNYSIQFRIFLLTNLLTFYLMVKKSQGILICCTGIKNEAFESYSHSRSSKISICEILIWSSQVTLITLSLHSFEHYIPGLNLMFSFLALDHQNNAFGLVAQSPVFANPRHFGFQGYQCCHVFKMLFNTWFFALSVSSWKQYL